MEINISAIVNDKIKQLEETGIIKSKIEESIEKVILSEISGGLDNYELRRNISNAVKDTAGTIVSAINFPAYNGFIAQTIKNIMDGEVKADLAEKIQSSIEKIMFNRVESIKLSEIFKKYYDWVCENTDEADKWEKREFTHELEVREDGNFRHFEIKFSDEKLDKYDNAQIRFNLCDYKEKGTDTLEQLYFEDTNMAKTLVVDHLNDFQSFMLNLMYNKTEIILDIEDVEEYGYYDIDC